MKLGERKRLIGKIFSTLFHSTFVKAIEMTKYKKSFNGKREKPAKLKDSIF